MSDMYIQCGQTRIADVQSYHAKHGPGEMFFLTLDKVYLTAESIQNHVDLNNLGSFSFIVHKHDRIIQYHDCYPQATCCEERSCVDRLWVNSYRRTEALRTHV